MSRVMPFPDAARARDQAAEWFAKRDRGLDAAEQVEFDRWCAQRVNARALEEFEQLWRGMDQLALLAEIFPSETTAPAPAPAPVSVRSRPRRWAVAAGIGVVALAGLLALGLTRRPPSPPAVVATAEQTTPAPRVTAHATAVGEQRTVMLADGSSLSLNTNSLVEVAFKPDERALTLVRGEVHFEVAHDPSRPFRVRAGDRTVQAVGTAFDVRLRPQQAIDVVVTEGIVAIGPQKLTAGQALQVAADGTDRIDTLSADDLGRRTAWQRGMLVFEGESLDVALEEFSRYSTDRFVIADPKLAQLRIGGYFPAGDTTALQRALQTGFGLRVSRESEGVWRIARAQ